MSRSEERRDSTPPPGTLLDETYRIGEEIGRGAMGVVYVARDEHLERDVAVKLLRPELEADPGLQASFAREARTLAAIRQPSVVDVYAFGRSQGRSYFVMELLRGQTADQWLAELARDGRRVPFEESLRVAREASLGLAAVHDSGVVHRDVKPANIMIEEGSGRVVLMDFGLGKRAPTEGTTRRTALAGFSPAYAAPEILDSTPGAKVSEARADIFSLGVTTFELIVGCLPAECEGSAEPPVGPPTLVPRASSQRPGLPRGLDAILGRAAAHLPKDRFRSARDFAAALEALHGADARATAAPEPEDVAALESPKPWAAGLHVVAVSPDATMAGPLLRAAEPLIRGGRLELTRSNRSALALAQQMPPDLLVASLDDDELNGLELSAMLHGTPELVGLPIVLIAKGVNASERALLEQMGVSTVLVCPCSQAEVHAALGDALGLPVDRHD